MPERLRIILAALALLALPASALGWNDRGHRTVAYVAYTNLSTAPSNNVRARVDALLKLNPSYAEWTAGVSPANRGVVAFMNASVWPDVIKDKAGYTESPKCAFAEHTNGFDDKGRHRTWHYLDLPFSFDGTPHQQQCKHNAYTIIVTFRTRLAATNAPGVPNLDREKAYDLGWLIHLVGDIHQPLHATGRFSAGTPDGDGGGNGYDIQGFTPEGANFQVRELHGFWDNVLGVDQNPTSPQAFAKVQTLANEVTSRFKQDPGGPQATNDAAVAEWLKESFFIGRYFVYEIDREKVGSARPAISARYNFYAQQIARHRVAVAGYRLADLLNQNLK